MPPVSFLSNSTPRPMFACAIVWSAKSISLFFPLQILYSPRRISIAFSSLSSLPPQPCGYRSYCRPCALPKGGQKYPTNHRVCSSVLRALKTHPLLPANLSKPQDSSNIILEYLTVHMNVGNNHGCPYKCYRACSLRIDFAVIDTHGTQAYQYSIWMQIGSENRFCGDITYLLINGSQSHYKHIKIWWIIIYILNVRFTRKKLNNKSNRAYFVGYAVTTGFIMYRNLYQL